MSTRLTISGKVMGKTRPTFTDWELTLPEAIEIETLSLRSLLTHSVFAEVNAFETQQSQLLRILSPQQIQLGVEQGKIEFGGSELDQTVYPHKS